MALGNLEFIGDKQVITGSSGISGKDLIDAKIAPINKKIENKQKDNEKYDKKITAYAELTVLLKEFQKSSDSLRNPHIFDSSAEANAFKSRQLNLTSSTISVENIESYVTGIAYTGLDSGKHTIQITNLAEAKSQMYVGFPSKNTDVVTGGAGMFSAGTFQINGTDITLEAGDDLAKVVDKINKSQAGVSAGIQKISGANYAVRLSADKTGIANAYSITDTARVLRQLNTGVSINAADAVFTFDGQAVTRAENTFNDMLDGENLELTLRQPTGTDTIDIVIENDTGTASKAVINYIAKYNEIMKFAYKQQERQDDGNYRESAVLAREQEFFNTITQLTTTVGSRVDGLMAGAKSTFKDIGIIIADSIGNFSDPDSSPAKHILAFDQDDMSIFNKALTANLDEVRKVFEFDYTSSSTALSITHRSNNISTSSFTVDIDTSRPNIIEGDNSIQDKVRIIVGSTTYRPNYYPSTKEIKGQSGSPIEGLVMRYDGTGVDNIQVELTQGIADKTYNLLENLTRETPLDVDELVDGKKIYDDDGNVKKLEKRDSKFKGIMYMAVEKITGFQDTNIKEIEKLNEKKDKEREKLLKAHSANEANIAKFTQLRQSLDNQFKAMYSSR